MDEGTKSKRTVFIGNLGNPIDEASLVSTFSTFGDIVDAQIPNDLARDNVTITYRGIAFLTYTSTADASDAIDNMDSNVYAGRVLRVSLAKPRTGPAVLGGGLGNRAIWESEEWLKENTEKEKGSGAGTGEAAGEGAEEGGGEDDPMEE